MLGNENIASKPRAGRALPPRCHFLPHAGVENKAAEKGRSGDRSFFDALVHVDSARKCKQKTSGDSCFQNRPEGIIIIIIIIIIAFIYTRLFKIQHS